MITNAIRILVDHDELDPKVAAECMRELMSGKATPAQTAAFLTALKIRGESPSVIAAMAEVMKSFATPIKANVSGRLIDTCGTGGDSVKTINVSTASGLVVAACGGYVAKHGNRSFTGHCGSADFLEELGVRIDPDPEVVANCIESLGFGFIYAPRYHPSMRNVMSVRKEIAIRTIFNILGPLTNPAPINAQVLGVYSQDLIDRVAEALKLIGRDEAMIYHGLGGIDEVSIFSETMIAWLRDGVLKKKKLGPEDFGFEKARMEELFVKGREECVKKTVEVLAGKFSRNHPLTRLLLANSSVSLLVAGLADDLKYGVELAWMAIESGRVLKLLEDLVKKTGGDRSRLESKVEAIR